jgi:hypothetical protein
MAESSSKRLVSSLFSSSFTRRREPMLTEVRLENTILSRMVSKDAALRFYMFSRRADVAFVRGVSSAVGALFGFLSLLKVTPPWTSFIYLAGLLPEILKLAVHVDLKVHAVLIREFEYIIIVLSGLLFAGIMAYVLQDLRSVVPITMFLVVLSSQAQDASIPFQQHKTSAALYYAVGGLACVAVYILIQFGFVPDLVESNLSFGGGNGKQITISDVQFACDRLITAAAFLLKQAFVAYFYPDSFVSLREMVVKKVILGNEGELSGTVAPVVDASDKA